jgi:hypothetical protein
VNRSLPDNIEHYVTDIGARRRASCIIAGLLGNFAVQLMWANFSAIVCG